MPEPAIVLSLYQADDLRKLIDLTAILQEWLADRELDGPPPDRALPGPRLGCVVHDGP
jgi:hypothetical protein